MTQQTNNAAALGESEGTHGAGIVNGHGGGSAACINLAALAAEFPRSQISWRAQTLSKDGEKALALAYIDARDVAERLDAVCGAANWQNRYSHADKKTVCEIGIKIGDEWVWKANGAGDSDVEAEKGALSDAFKRAATMWGIGRYLYGEEFKGVWAACETYEKNGKKVWSSWKGDPWKGVRAQKPAANQNKAPQPPLAPPPPESKPKLSVEDARVAFIEKIKAAKTEAALRKVTDTDSYRRLLEALDGKPEKTSLMTLVTERFEQLIPQTTAA